MTLPHIDTDVLIRFLTGDDPVKQAEADALLQRVARGELTVTAPDTVIADAVYVLASPRLFRRSRPQIQVLLDSIVGLPHFRIQNKSQVLRALAIYATTRLDFGDALIVASMETSGATTLYSYDQDFDRFESIERHAPG